MEAESKAARVEAALEAAPHCIRGAHYTIGSQSHFYMEPQVHPVVLTTPSAEQSGASAVKSFLQEDHGSDHRHVELHLVALQSAW